MCKEQKADKLFEISHNVDFDFSDVGTARKPSLKETLPQPICYEELVASQKKDPFCEKIVAKISRRKRSSACFEGKHEILLCRTSPIDAKKQFVLPKNIHQRVLKLAHQALLAVHPGVARMVEGLR